MSWVLIAKGVHQTTNSNGFTTPPFDSSGADTHLVAISRLHGTTPAITDSRGFTWIPLTSSDNAPDLQWVYAVGAGGSGHTLTVSGTGVYVSIARYHFSGGAASPLDTGSPKNNFNPAGTSVQPGSQTPSVDNCLVVLGGAFGGDVAGIAITGGFSTPDAAGTVGGTAYGIAGSYLIQTTAAPANPTLSWTNSQGVAVSLAVFKPASATNYTLGAAAGSYAIAGTAAALKAARRLAAAGGSYVLTGTPASAIHTVLGVSGVYTITGTPVTFRKGISLAAGSGSYASSGTPAALSATRTIAMAGGAYSVAGAVATLTKSSARTLVATEGSYSLSGTATGFQLARAVRANAGSYAIAGQATTLIGPGGLLAAVPDLVVQVRPDDVVVRVRP